MPSAENQFIRGTQSLRDVIDGYNDPWLKTEPIYGRKPQPDHARVLKWSVFTESQRRKLGIRPDEKSPYTAREDMYFPYLTAEVKYGNQALEIADRQNMHSMCIALRAVVSLCQAAGCAEEVQGGFSDFRSLMSSTAFVYTVTILISKETKCFSTGGLLRNPTSGLQRTDGRAIRFVENVDREFLRIHTDRLTRSLGRVPDPEDDIPGIDVDEVESQPSFPSQIRCL